MRHVRKNGLKDLFLHVFTLGSSLELGPLEFVFFFFLGGDFLHKPDPKYHRAAP